MGSWELLSRNKYICDEMCAEKSTHPSLRGESVQWNAPGMGKTGVFG